MILAYCWRQNGGTRKAHVIIPLAYSSDMEDFYDVVVHQQLLMKIEKAFPECSEEKCLTIYQDVLKCVRNTRYVSENCFHRYDRCLVSKATVVLRRWNSETKFWFYQTSWYRFNYHRERLRKPTFRALAHRQSLRSFDKTKYLFLGDELEVRFFFAFSESYSKPSSLAQLIISSEWQHKPQMFRNSGINRLSSLYVLFTRVKPRDATLGKWACARANGRITYEKNKRKIPIRTSLDLKLRRSISRNWTATRPSQILHIRQQKKSGFARFARAYFAAVHVPSTTRDDLLCSCMEDVITWRKNVNIFYLQAALTSLAPGEWVHVLQVHRLGIIEKLLQLHLGALALMTATATKTSVENKHLENGGYFVIIASSSHPLLLTEHAVNGQVEASGVEVNIENGQFTFVCPRSR